MAKTYAIVVPSKGQTIPDAYLKLLLDEYNSSIGMSYTNPDGLLSYARLAYSADEPPYNVEDFKALIEEHKEVDLTIVVGKADNNELMHEGELQPYDAIVNEQQEPVVQIVLEGDFSSHHHAESTWSDEFHAANKYIIPVIQRVWQSCGQDLDKLVNELNDPLNKQMIANAATTRGAITVIVQGFPAMTFDKNAGGSQFPWGWVSQTLDYKEEPPKKTVNQKVMERVSNALSRKRPVTAPAVASPPTPPKTDTAVKAPPAKPENKEGPVTDVSTAQQQAIENAAEQGVEMLCAPDILTGKERRQWYIDNCQFVPKNHWEKDAKAPAKVKSFKDLPRPKAEIIQTHERVGPGPREPADAGPIMIPATKIKQVQELTTLDRNAQRNPIDIKQLQALEAKKPTFFDQIGEKNETLVDYWPDERFMALGKLDLNSLVLLCISQRNAKMMAQHDVDILTKPDKAVETGKSADQAQPKPSGGVTLRRRAQV